MGSLSLKGHLPPGAIRVCCSVHFTGGSKKDSNIQFVRSVPKFLQGHKHLLGRKLPEDEEEAQLASVDEDNNGAGSEDDEKVAVLSSHNLALSGL